jgi:hypothetical protein
VWGEATVNNNPDEITRNTEALARKNLTTSLQAISQVGQAEISKHLNFSTSTVSRIKSERLEEVVKVLPACGLKLVPRDYSYNNAEFIDAALLFAAYGLKAVRRDPRLLIED